MRVRLRRAAAIEIPITTEYLIVALRDLQAMVLRGEGGFALQDLLRHAHELVEILNGSLQRLGDIPVKAAGMDMAGRLSAQLEVIEREITGKSLH